MHYPNSHYTRSSSAGAVMVETAIGFLVVILFIGILINLSYYIYVLNAVESAVHRGLTRASWQIDLEKPANDPDFDAAREAIVEYIKRAVAEGVYGPVEILSDEIVIDFPEHGGDLRSVTDTGLVIGLPAADSTGTREAPFMNQPIGIAANFNVPLLLPIPGFSQLHGHVEAWGYREPPSGLPVPPVLDCNGNPFDRHNPPESCPLCPDGPINPLTGHCGCPPGKVPGTDAFGAPKCVCANLGDLKANCNWQVLIDEENCECGVSCFDVTTHLQKGRLEDNTCGCTRVDNTDGNCHPDRFVPDPDNPGRMKFEKTNCNNQNCAYLGSAGWAADACRCYCHGAYERDGSLPAAAPWVGSREPDAQLCNICMAGASMDIVGSPGDQFNYCKCDLPSNCNSADNEAHFSFTCQCGCVNDYSIRRTFDQQGPLDCGNCGSGQEKGYLPSGVSSGIAGRWKCCPPCGPNAVPVMASGGSDIVCKCACADGYISSGQSRIVNTYEVTHEIFDSAAQNTCVPACGNEPCGQ